MRKLSNERTMYKKQESSKDKVNEERFTVNLKNNYPHRKETVEMIFGDSKEQ